MRNSITFDSVRKSFRQRDGIRTILDGFTLDVATGELVALVGPSGVGKSTLLHLLAKLDDCDGGRVSVSPRDDGSPARVGMVFQEPRLLNWLTVEKNLQLAVEAARGDPSRVGEFLDEVGLREHAHSFPLSLSGGQRQRVSLARALAIEPDILLLDEPFSALDEANANRLRSLLQNLWSTRKMSGILVTHNLAEAAFLADRVVVVDGPPLRSVDVVEIELPRPRDVNDPHLTHVVRRLRNRGIVEVGAS